MGGGGGGCRGNDGGGGIYCLAGLITGNSTQARGVCVAVFTSGYGDGVLDRLL